MHLETQKQTLNPVMRHCVDFLYAELLSDLLILNLHEFLQKCVFLCYQLSAGLLAKVALYFILGTTYTLPPDYVGFRFLYRQRQTPEIELIFI